MKDQIDQLKARGLAAERLDSTLDAAQGAVVMQAVRNGQLRLLYVAPERFNNERFREAMQRVRVSLFAIDEAHCISEWGHNFRPDYLKLARFAQQCRAERLLALTATATPAVLDDICRGFHIAPQCAVRTRFYRPNLTVLLTPMSADQRDAELHDRLASHRPGPTIVYVTLQRTAEQVAARLASDGFPARPYHAGMQDEDRASVQDWFLHADQAIVVATIAFGMGIDKANIRSIYHYNLPKSLENFTQEIGRAGRDGLPSTCEVFVCPDDLNALENFAYGDTPSSSAVASLLHEIFSCGEAFDVSLSELSGRHDIRPLVLRTLLTYLELDGYLEEGTPFYASYQFQPLATSAEILGRFEGQRRAFLTQLFRQAQKARKWFHIDLEQAAHAIGAPRERIVRALDYLEAQGLLQLQVAGVRQRFRRLARPQDLPGLAQRLEQRLQQRETREIERLHEVLQLAGHNGCQVSRLGAHFGEPLERPCGHCSWCMHGRQPVRLLPRPNPPIADHIWQEAMAVQRDHSEALPDALALARFLCGLTSPKLTRARLGAHRLFGAFSNVPFHVVRQRAEA
jgi:ATP-dependent DNA helicase RecQ